VHVRGTGPRRYVAQILVIALGLTSAGLAVQGAVDAGTTGFSYARAPQHLASQRRLHRDFEAARATFVATVPPGSRVVIDPPLRHLWHQRLAEFTALTGGTLVVDHQQADYQVRLIERRTSTGTRYHVEFNEINR